MSTKNKVLKSINLDGDLRCVDIFERPNGSFGFEEYRRDVEDGKGWFPVGGYSNKLFPSAKTALHEACNKVRWLSGKMNKIG